MSEDDRRFLLDMKAILERYLDLINEQILDYKPEDDDEKHEFLLKKAIRFRNDLRKVNEQLNQDNGE